MAEVNAKDLTTKTAPASTDSMLLFGTSTNEGAKITVDNLANNILERLTTKTFANQVGGSSAATILAQLATLNSNMYESITPTLATDLPIGNVSAHCNRIGKLVVVDVAFRISTGETLASNSIFITDLPAAINVTYDILYRVTTGGETVPVSVTNANGKGKITIQRSVAAGWVYGTIVYVTY